MAEGQVSAVGSGYTVTIFPLPERIGVQEVKDTLTQYGDIVDVQHFTNDAPEGTIAFFGEPTGDWAIHVQYVNEVSAKKCVDALSELCGIFDLDVKGVVARVALKDTTPQNLYYQVLENQVEIARGVFGVEWWRMK